MRRETSTLSALLLLAVLIGILFLMRTKTVPAESQSNSSKNSIILVHGFYDSRDVPDKRNLDQKRNWIEPYLLLGRKLPDIRVRISKHPETDEYQFSGGAIGIPFTRLETGYDVDLGTEEYKATLQWKKSF